jgi:hypothetical protein
MFVSMPPQLAVDSDIARMRSLLTRAFAKEHPVCTQWLLQLSGSTMHYRLSVLVPHA